MNGLKINTKAKKLVALLLIATITIGYLFASPLNLASSLNDAKIYNENYKAENNPSTINQGWIVLTKESQISFKNQSLNLTVGENSLVQITSLDDENPTIYLLDGWLCVTSAENVNLTVNTTVTNYTVTAGSSVIVISSASTENGYVQQGSAKVLNAITKVSNTLEAGTYLDFSQPSAQPMAKEPEVKIETVEPEAETESVVEIESTVEEEPATETEPVIEEEPVETTEPTVEEPTIEEPVEEETTVEAEPTTETVAEQTTEQALVPLTKTFYYNGYEATVTAYVGQAIVEYPAFVTADEIYTAAEAAYKAYKDYLDGVYIQVVEDGKAVVTYPETYGEDEFNFAVSLLEVDIPFYIASVLNEDAPEIDVEANVNVDLSEPVIIEIVAPDTPATKAEAETEAEAEAEEETTTEIEVTTETTAEAQPVAETTEAETTVEVVAETEPTAEAQPVAQPATEVVATTEVKATKKKNSFKFGVAIGAIYGQYEDGANFKPFVDKDYIRNVGFDPKSIIVNIDPYISVGNFTFGLHVSLDILSVKDFFTFDTENGAAGYVNSISKFIGRINYNSDNVQINIDRNHNIEFSSPVFYSMDKAFDKNNSLVATASANFGFIKVNAFADDVQLTNYLNGKDQYAGLSLAAQSKYLTVTASAIAQVHSLENIDIYPAIDVNTNFNVLKANVNLYAGFSSVFANTSITNTKTFLAKAKATVDFSNVFDFAVGAAYNHNMHINNVVNNSYINITTPFEGNSLDVLLSSGLHLGIFTFDGSMSIPLSLNEDRTGKLAYQTITTADGTTKEISADVMSLSASLNLGIVSLSSGVLYNGFTAKVANLAKALKNSSEVNSNLKAIVDPDLATFYTMISVNLGFFNAYIRGDLLSIDDVSKISTSIGASLTF